MTNLCPKVLCSSEVSPAVSFQYQTKPSRQLLLMHFRPERKFHTRFLSYFYEISYKLRFRSTKIAYEVQNPNSRIETQNQNSSSETEEVSK